MPAQRKSGTMSGSTVSPEQAHLPSTATPGMASDGWRIALCNPHTQFLREVQSNKLTLAAHIQQVYIADALRSRGHQLTFLAARGLFDIVCTADLQAPTPARLGWSGSRAFGLASKLAWRMQRWLGIPYLNFFSDLRLLDACLRCLPDHDIVQERNSLYRTGIARACKKLRIPYILFFDGDEIFELDSYGQPLTGLLRWRAERMMRYTLEAADAIICVCQESKAHITAAYGVPPQKIAVLANGVDVHRFRPRADVRRRMREALQIGQDPLLLFVGAFYPWHDVGTLLEAFASILGKHPGAHLLLVGDGEQRREMEARAEGLGLNGSARFVGMVGHDRVPDYINAADIAVAPFIPRQHDLGGSPMKLYEYLASGATIVASNVGQITQVIQDGVNGCLVPLQDAAALAATLDQLISDPALRQRLGRQAREDAVHKHSWERYVMRLERLYEAVRTGGAVDEV